MDITKILKDLGIDFSNPDAKQGAIEAIDAILGSRSTMSGSGGGSSGGQDIEVEIDPDLIQPSIKQPAGGMDDEDIEIEDEEDILSQVKLNDSEDDSDDTDSDGDASSNSSSNTSDLDSSSSTNNDEEGSAEDDDAEEDDLDISDSDSDEMDSDEATSKESASELDSDEEAEEEEEESDIDTPDDDDKDSEDSDNYHDSVEDEDEEEEDSEDDYDFDEDDLVDDDLKGIEDEEIKKKEDARKIKRERTLTAAKKALADAQARKVSPALIRELEKSIEALEALTEAVKSIKDISDEEFNQLVNRVFDAIDAVGDKSLTFTSDEERAIRAQEIKKDLSSTTTQNELSAEDIAKIRAENQAIKAREKENAKYQTKARGSFKGFQDFLNSLYRAVALQVATEENRDSSWSSISRRNSGVGVLQQGKKVQELSNKKIPVIDFYFDQSGSWDEDDIKVGEKAVQCLADMEEKGDIKINVYYFANHVHTDAQSARNEGGTRAWNDIIKNVISTQATNVIIMTDSDMENWWSGDTALSYTVPGYVWYLWRNGINAPRLPRDLKGRGGVQQFSFNASDM